MQDDDELKSLTREYLRKHPEVLARLRRQRALQREISAVSRAVAGIEGRILRELEQDGCEPEST
jgi:hypothetical protein